MWSTLIINTNISLFGSFRKGDSGGPILATEDNLNTVYGVCQSICIPEESESPTHGVATPVAFNLDWIIDTMHKQLDEL